MKKLRKLSKKQKEYLSDQGLNPEEYLLERQDYESYTFYNVLKEKLELPMRR